MNSAADKAERESSKRCKLGKMSLITPLERNENKMEPHAYASNKKYYKQKELETNKKKVNKKESSRINH